MSLEESKTIRDAFEAYNTRRLELITDPRYALKRKMQLLDENYADYLKWYKGYRKQLEEEREAKKKEREEAKKNGIYKGLR